MQKILIIEDDPAIRDELSLLLTNEGYTPLAPADFTDIPALAARYAPDLILLDINLPGQDGFSLCAKLRKTLRVPIIFVTSRDSGLDEVRALSLGGDDYIAKPYSIPVLLARIKAVLRRTGKAPAPSDIMEYGGLELNLTKGTVSVKNKIKTETQRTATKTITKTKAKPETRPESALLTRNELQILASLLIRAAFAAISILFLLATGTQADVLWLLCVIWLLAFLCAQAVDFLRLRSHLRELEHILEGLDQKYLFSECIPKSRNIYERKLTDLFRRSGRAMIGAVSDAQAAQREYREYVESWVHEIKTPITAAGLICQNAEADTRRRLSPELSQIEAHVERALFYARAESPEKDFILRRTQLSEIAARALGQHKALLIQSGVRVETEGLEQAVYTDGKWAAFILGQLLQNAVRYRNEASTQVITLSAKPLKPLGKQVQLTVTDNGIGIPAHELPRVFDRGFTGSNGRARGGSTGMGLYLCRKLADCLEMELRISSITDSRTAATGSLQPTRDDSLHTRHETTPTASHLRTIQSGCQLPGYKKALNTLNTGPSHRERFPERSFTAGPGTQITLTFPAVRSSSD